MYRSELDPRLVESVRTHGIVEPIVVAEGTRTIVSGHRRWQAAQKVRLRRVPVRFLGYPDEAAELEALLVFNRQRSKTEGELAAEFELYLEIERMRAKERMVAGGKAGGRGKGRTETTYPSRAPSAPGPAHSTAVALAGKTVGWGPTKSKQYAAVVAGAPTLAAKVRAGELGVNAASKKHQARADSDRPKKKPSAKTTSKSSRLAVQSTPTPASPKMDEAFSDPLWVAGHLAKLVKDLTHTFTDNARTRMLETLDEIRLELETVAQPIDVDVHADDDEADGVVAAQVDEADEDTDKPVAAPESRNGDEEADPGEDVEGADDGNPAAHDEEPSPVGDVDAAVDVPAEAIVLSDICTRAACARRRRAPRSARRDALEARRR